MYSKRLVQATRTPLYKRACCFAGLWHLTRDSKKATYNPAGSSNGRHHDGLSRYLLPNVRGILILFIRVTRGLNYVARRIAAERLSREMPLKMRLTPTSIPSTQAELDGHCAHMKIASTKVTIASNKTQPAFVCRRMVK